MATGYKHVGKIKEVVLPIPSDTITPEEYKKRYGIDLYDLFYVKNKTLKCKYDNVVFWLKQKDANPDIRPVIIVYTGANGDLLDNIFGYAMLVDESNLHPAIGLVFSCNATEIETVAYFEY